MKSIELDISGLGIVFHSPAFSAHIAEGQDYLTSDYTTDVQVQEHIQQGTMVGFATGSPGRFQLRFYAGYPDDNALAQFEFKLRLGLNCRGGRVCFRDLYELMDWRQECLPEHTLQLEDGFYHVTLCSNRPDSGILGDNQIIDFYLQKLQQLPTLANHGIPSLCG